MQYLSVTSDDDTKNLGYFMEREGLEALMVL